jgi:mRNA-degrading endonuclease HigB of HigAB toxin-antitoxin module
MQRIYGGNTRVFVVVAYKVLAVFIKFDGL